MPQGLSNSISKVEKVNTNNKDVNDNKLKLVGQSNATVKTNKNHTSTATANYKSRHNALFGTTLDGTAANNDKFKHRDHQDA